MKHIFLDFEMHPIDRKYSEDRKTIRNEIIEFGAVMLDDDLSEISSFREYVRPERMDRMAMWIKDFTGITEANLFRANKFADVLRSFVNWCHSKGKDIRIYAWSKNDLEQLQGEMKIKHIDYTPEFQELMDKWEDYQKEYCELINADKPIKLERALNEIGIKFDGRMHDALWDSRNTAQLFRETRDKDAFMKAREAIRNWISDDEKGLSFCSLGDLFDFGALTLA